VGRWRGRGDHPDPLAKLTPGQLIKIGISHPPYFPSGTSFDYSNTAYILAGKA
jgi:D-alanyl-D-alanine carboxypeptidase